MPKDLFNTLDSFKSNGQEFGFYSLPRLAQQLGDFQHLPYSIRILLENLLRNCDGVRVTTKDVQELAGWTPQGKRHSLPFTAARVVLQDFTGVPVMNDLAAMRAALSRLGGNPERINPVTPVDLVIDHSVQVDYSGSPDAYAKNVEREFERNHERYLFLRWAQNAFNNFRVIPPATGIIHQINLEYLTRLAMVREEGNLRLVFPETLVGTDSHTTMINGLGVVGWGVGGIEAVAAMLGEPIEIPTPDVIGIRLTGKLTQGVTPTDLTLTIVQLLRKIGVVEKFVEFYGPGYPAIGLADRAMIANMTPETGATMLYFPADRRSIEYLMKTGRDGAFAQAAFEHQNLYVTPDAPEPSYSQVVEVELESIEPSLAGPKRPQDRIALSQVPAAFQSSLHKPKTERGYGLTAEQIEAQSHITLNGQPIDLGHGTVVLASITSCTNTSNPTVMIGAGLLAKKAVEKGLQPKPWVKASLSPGSRVVSAYLEKAGLMEPLARAGFDLVGYGCMTCIGNSGPLNPAIVSGINENNLVSAAVISGNRNFEGRVHPHVQANFLASPPLVVAYALAGNVNLDLRNDPLGTDREGNPVYLRDIWPSQEEVEQVIHDSVDEAMFRDNYANVYFGDEGWNALEVGSNRLYQWAEDSTYLQEPPFFTSLGQAKAADIRNARVLGLFGDSVTTDHISPAGNIAINSAAGKYLIQQGVKPADFNSYGSRRGNDRVMTRGTFGNIRIKNLLLGSEEGSFTLYLPENEKMSFFDAAQRYRTSNTPLIVIAGKEYGTGSSRDWAAKGVLLLGVRAVIAESFERIHRSNLAGMGVLPLQFQTGEGAASLGLTGREKFSIEGMAGITLPNSMVEVKAVREDGSTLVFQTLSRLDTANEVRYFHGGGILNIIVQDLLH